MAVTGEGRRGILIVAEAPGKNEDDQGVQLVGESGQLMEAALRKCGVSMRRDCWLTNAVICRPRTAGDHNRTPTEKEIGYCQPNLTNTVKKLNPQTIIVCGGPATKSLIEPVWKDDMGFAVERWAGWQIPCQELNAWIFPTYHPAYILYEKSPTLQMFLEGHIAAAAAKTSRPWDTVPDFASRVKVIIDEKRAVEEIMMYTECATGPVAFDYETNMLKPDSDKAQIVCCSLSDGRQAAAFPWHGKVIAAMRHFLRSSVGKIAHNLKFEERWTLKEFGHGVSNWCMDTMISTHVLDCRKAISGLKFQSFVQFGCGDYSKVMKMFMGGLPNMPNRIKQAPIRQLLLYCGLDSLYAHKLARRHAPLVGVAA